MSGETIYIIEGCHGKGHNFGGENQGIMGARAFMKHQRMLIKSTLVAINYVLPYLSYDAFVVSLALNLTNLYCMQI